MISPYFPTAPLLCVALLLAYAVTIGAFAITHDGRMLLAKISKLISRLSATMFAQLSQAALSAGTRAR
jgi:hypothetical protein